MEAAAEEFTLLHKILPPRLEDAGLENCALPPHSIHEAFLKAASAVGCAPDPATEKSPPSDVLVGVQPEGGPPGPCAVVKGGDWVEGGGDVVVAGDGNEDENAKKDDVVVVGESGGCVDELKGLDEVKEKENEDQDDDDEKPTLVEGFF